MIKWFQKLSPKRKFAIKCITKIAAASIPVVGDQIQALFDTAFEELEDHERVHDLVELTQLVDQRFDRLITQIEARQLEERQVEAVITRYLHQNESARQADLQAIEQCVLRVHESLAQLYQGLQRVEDKVDHMGLQLDSLLADIAQVDAQAEQREDHARIERAKIQEQILRLQRQMTVQSRGSLSDSLSIRGDQEREMIRQLLKRYRALPQDQRESIKVANDLGVLLSTAQMHSQADKVLSEAREGTLSQEEIGSIEFNRYMNALKANDLDQALEHYLCAVKADARVALFPIDKFTPKKILGFGAFGVTFLCDQFNLKIAAKSISLDPNIGDSERVVRQFAQEWTTLISLSDPRIIKALDFDPNRQLNGELRPYLTMKYFPGESLQTHREERPHLLGIAHLDRTLTIALEIAKGLHAAHQRNVIHRDIKPANILLRVDRDPFELRIIDFGLAPPPPNLHEQSMFISSSPDPSAPRSILANQVVGTMQYAPPEQ